MSKDEAMKLALEFVNDIRRGKYKGDAEEISTALEQVLAAFVHFAWMRYEADCAGDSVLVLARSTEEGAFKVYKEPPTAKPAQEQYAALEQAPTRLQKRYGELEARLAANQTTEESSEVQQAPVQETVALDALVKEEMRYYHDGHYLASSDAKYQLLSFAHRISKSVRASTPPATQRPWVGLTDVNAVELWQLARHDIVEFARVIEAKLKELNT